MPPDSSLEFLIRIFLNSNREGGGALIQGVILVLGSKVLNWEGRQREGGGGGVIKLLIFFQFWKKHKSVKENPERHHVKSVFRNNTRTGWGRLEHTNLEIITNVLML